MDRRPRSTHLGPGHGAGTRLEVTASRPPGCRQGDGLDPCLMSGELQKLLTSVTKLHACIYGVNAMGIYAWPRSKPPSRID
jgi:hypothetical protein